MLQAEATRLPRRLRRQVTSLLRPVPHEMPVQVLAFPHCLQSWRALAIQQRTLCGCDPRIYFIEVAQTVRFHAPQNVLARNQTGMLNVRSALRWGGEYVQMGDAQRRRKKQTHSSTMTAYHELGM
jgi:hypothetical protein